MSGISGREQPMTELELDAVLRSFLRDGAEASHQRIAEQAMAEVRTTRQDRPLLVPPRWWHAAPMATAWAAAVAVLLTVSIGLLVIQPIGPKSTPSLLPTPSGAPNDLVLAGSAQDGFEVLVPAAWTQVGFGPGVWKWEGPDGELMVSYGTSVLEGGVVQLCGPPTPEWPVCSGQTFTYSIPFDPEVDGVAPLSITPFVSDRCVGGCDVTTTETTLDGELAERNQITAGDILATYVSTFHDRRPVVLYWSEPGGAGDEDRIERMRNSFRFLDEPVVSPTPFVDPTELVPFIEFEVGYEIRVPRFWGSGEPNALFPGVHEWGSGVGFGTRGHPAFTVSVGDRDGSIVVCQGTNHDCATQVATTLDELDALLVAVGMNAQSGPVEATGDTQVAGVPGRFKTASYSTSSHGCLGCPGMLYHAYAIVDGRPVIMSFDYWTWTWELDKAYSAEIVESLRFVDNPATPAPGSAGLFRVPFTYELPDGWLLTSESSSEVIFSRGSELVRLVHDARPPTSCEVPIDDAAPHGPDDLVSSLDGRLFLFAESTETVVGGLDGFEVGLTIRKGGFELAQIYQTIDGQGRCALTALEVGYHLIYALNDGADGTILIRITGSSADARSEAALLVASLDFDLS